MHRTIGDGFIVDGVTGHNIYADEDLGSGRDATQVRHEEMNALQEEVANVIEQESIVLNSTTEPPSQMTQLDTAINNKLKSDRIDNQSTAPGSKVTDALTGLKTVSDQHTVSINSNISSIGTLNTRITDHKHGSDGITSVNLASEVQGTLPFASVQGHVHGSGIAGYVNLSTGVDGLLSASRQWDLIEPFTFTFGSCFSTLWMSCWGMVTDQMAYGGQFTYCTLMLVGCYGDSATIDFEAPAGSIPSRYRPAYNIMFPTMVIDNNLRYPGLIEILDTGAVNVFKNPTSGNDYSHSSAKFLATGTKGYNGCGCTYLTNI
jgi:hypothetical protein